MSGRVARLIVLVEIVASLVVSVAIGIRADTPAWSPVTWGIFFLAFAVFLGGPIALVLEWRATHRWTQPNPYAADRDQILEPIAPPHVD